MSRTTQSGWEDRIRGKLRWRLLPFLFALYIVASLDRANVAYAKTEMMAARGFSESVFGFGAGIFFVGYLLLEIPGALIVERRSARRWFARILITWGICAVFLGFVRTASQFFGVRFILGLAEGGFFPGMVVYLTHWFCARERARALAIFILAVPVSLSLGGPVSGLFLKLDWFGLAGWQWLFILEGLPAVLLGVLTLVYFTDYPKDVSWLTPAEQKWISIELEAESKAKKAIGDVSIWEALRKPQVILLALALFFANIGIYSFIFWLPSTVQAVSGRSAAFAATFSALPFTLAVITVVVTARSSDLLAERRWHTVIPLTLSALLFMLSGLAGSRVLPLMGLLCATGCALFAWTPSFWTLPTTMLGESPAAASVGLINCVGNLGGFIGPSAVGFILSKNIHHSTVAACLAGSFVVSAALVAYCVTYSS